jgi:hypothetical protein
MNKNTIKEIESALKLHINYTGYSSGGEYLRRMDRLAWNYSGAPALKVSALLDDYFKVVNANNLDEAIQRLKALENA